MELNPEHSWARVELFRWQYGELPGESLEPDDREVQLPRALNGMAHALLGQAKDMPTAFNTASVLHYLSELLDDDEILALIKAKEFAPTAQDLEIFRSAEKSVNLAQDELIDAVISSEEYARRIIDAHRKGDI